MKEVAAASRIPAGRTRGRATIKQQPDPTRRVTIGGGITLPRSEGDQPASESKSTEKSKTERLTSGTPATTLPSEPRQSRGSAGAGWLMTHLRAEPTAPDSVHLNWRCQRCPSAPRTHSQGPGRS
jgi:hypothetical protein